MSETKLPEELEEQAIFHALGILDLEDRTTFMVRLQGESGRLREAVAAYQAALGVMADIVAPAMPPSTLRERLVQRIASEATREAGQFELAANTVALGAVPLSPPRFVRERLLSRVEELSDLRRDAEGQHAVQGLSALVGDRKGNACQTTSSQETGALSDWVRSCLAAVSNSMRTLFIRSVTPRPSSDGLTFVKASEGRWWQIAPGVTAKLLSFDSVSRRTTTLLRFLPGTSYAPHRHTAVEELYVLEGGCTIGDREMRVGDYHRAEAGTEHHDTSTDEGCLLLVISSPQDEMVR